MILTKISITKGPWDPFLIFKLYVVAIKVSTKMYICQKNPNCIHNSLIYLLLSQYKFFTVVSNFFYLISSSKY